MKTCKRCGLEKKLSEFDKSKKCKDGHINHCKECRRIDCRRMWDEKKRGVFVSKARLPRLSEEERELRTEELKTYQKEYRKNNAQKIRDYRKKVASDAQQEGIQIYGGKCSCCGEKRKEFLTMEHLNGRDKNKRKRTGKSAWLQLKIQGWPKKGITVLCYNCNCAKNTYGSCPHTWK